MSSFVRWSFMIICDICGGETKESEFRTFTLEIHEVRRIRQQFIEPIKILACYDCSKDGEAILERFKTRLNDVTLPKDLV
jgi:formylmethanofuran dehydrogenase subunit E